MPTGETEQIWEKDARPTDKEVVGTDKDDATATTPDTTTPLVSKIKAGGSCLDCGLF